MTESKRADDICPRPDRLIPSKTTPLAPPLIPASVWRCASPEQADALLAGLEDGYVYQRDRHPNGDMLAAKCGELHEAECAIVTSSGMAALALAMLSQTNPGERLLVSSQVYGKTLQLMETEASRWGLRAESFDPLDVPSLEQVFADPVRLVVVETISNPRLRVADISRLADYTHRHNGVLLVDNTFATPVLCRPLTWGADLVMESVSKMMNGHSDVMLGLLCGRRSLWKDVQRLAATWGWVGSPWDCWLAQRGLSSLHLRMERACANALAVARFLVNQKTVVGVDYPGLPTHPDHELAQRQLNGRFGSIVTFHLEGGQEAAANFIRRAADRIPFCPSLGEISTTLSHPASTSHRGLTALQREALGVGSGTIRLSCGIESADAILEAIVEALA